MVSTSSSIASASLHQTRFDVFLSFRGEDTRHTFTDHLYTALKEAAIHTFRDNDEIERGQDLVPEIVRAIENSRASVVILSENYAKSRWCLEELSLILKQKRQGNHLVLPVFYHVDPSDVRNQTRSFAIEGSKWTEKNVNRWRSALREVANLTGMVASGPETYFIAKIVDIIDSKLDLKVISTSAHLTGMETRAKDINYWLKNENSSVNVFAICGMGGCGKTTLAQYIYNRNKHNFKNSCFLEEIGKNFKQTYDLLELQRKLLTHILGGKPNIIACVSDGTKKIKQVLQMKKVLIVLDDITEHDELDALLGTHAIHTQSKIIITTRLLDIHSWFESRHWRCIVHELKLLDNQESLELFSCHAFGSKTPLEGFCDLAEELAEYCEGNALALKVLGSSLFVSAEDSRDRDSITAIWRSRLNSLSSMKGNLDCKIQGVLRKSFDSLPLASYRELFLHIAVFFVGEDEDYVAKILEHDWHAKSGIMTLINRCLLTISSKKKLKMHQLLQEMGRSIVNEESKDPAKRTRVWCSDEAYHMLTKGCGSETNEGLTLDARKLKNGTEALTIKTSYLAKMHKLKLLHLKYVKLSGHYKNFPDLRLLCWHGCRLRTMPSGLLTSDFLVAIDMTNGRLRKFEPPMVLNSLKILNLTSCLRLVSIIKLHRLPNLETLILWDCRRLTHVCRTIGDLARLTLLNLAECYRLWKSSSNKKNKKQQWLKSLGIGEETPEQPLHNLPRSLKFLFLNYFKLEHQSDLPVIFNGPLFGLGLQGNPFEFLPNSINLQMLRVLNLDNCKKLKSILCLPSTLVELYVHGCKSLEKVTFQSGRFRLKKFEYGCCFSLTEVQGLFKLMSIEELDESGLGHMKWIKAYQGQEVDLVGDEITNYGKIWNIQMLNEYGIRSTYLQGIKDPSMEIFEHTSSCQFLSFHVSLHPMKYTLKGLIVSFLYRLSKPTDKDRWILFTKISNRTKGITWIYNPLVYCKPKFDEDVMWLSYWPFGNMLDVGDDISVSILVEKGMMVSGCGASLVYTDGGGVEQEEKRENMMMELEMEVIGGDLSEFEVSTGVYYMCRRDIFKSATTDSVKGWFGDSVPCTKLQGWRKSYQSQDLEVSCMELNYAPELHRDTFYKRIWMGCFSKESDISKIKKAIYRLGGVDYVKISARHKSLLYVVGNVDSMAVETCAKEIEKDVWIQEVIYTNNHLRKVYHKVYKVLRMLRRQLIRGNNMMKESVLKGTNHQYQRISTEITHI